MKTFLLTLIAFSHYTNATQCYHWIDDKGVAHYSDSPTVSTKSAKKLTLSPSSVFKMPTFNKTTDNEQTKKTPQEIKASKIAILHPNHEQSFHNNQGNLTIALSTNHPLGKNQYVRLVLDGKRKKKQKELTIALKNIDRGSHSLQIQLIEKNKIQALSKEIIIFIHRPRKKMPKLK